MATLRKTYVFKGKPIETTNPRTFKFEMFLVKGRFGRAEAIDIDNPPSASNILGLGSFPKSIWSIDSITIDGVKIVNNNAANTDLVSVFNKSETATGVMTIVLTDKFQATTSQSKAVLTLISGFTDIPWISYRNNPQFNNNPNRGMIDYSYTPCRLLQVVQKDCRIDNPSKSYMIIPPGTLINLLIQTSVIAINSGGSQMINAYGYMTVIANKGDQYGSATQNDDGMFIDGLSKAMMPVANFTYKNNWMIVDETYPTSNIPLIIYAPGALTTKESFSLKYQTYNNIYDMIAILSYTYMEYDESLYDTSKTGIRVDKDGNPITVSTSYRQPMYYETINETTGTSGTLPERTYWFDRLHYLSTLGVTTIINTNSIKTYPSPTEYKANGFIDEYHYLNSKIKINKLCKLKNVSLVRASDDPANISTYDTLTYQIVIDRSNEEYINTIADSFNKAFKGNIKGISVATTQAAKVKLYVLQEPNGAGEPYGFTPQSDEIFTICGKLINPYWLKYQSYPGGTMLDQDELWEWLGVGKSTLKLIRQWANLQDPNLWAIVVRGKGSPNYTDEAISKYITYDSIIKEPTEPYDNTENTCAPPDFFGANIAHPNEILVYDNSNPPILFPIVSLCGYLPEANRSKDPIKLKISYCDGTQGQNGDLFFELTKKIIMPGTLMFHYLSEESLLCGCITAVENPTANSYIDLVFNYPEVGYSRKYHNSSYNNDLDIPRFELDVESVQNGTPPFQSKYFKIQILKDGAFYPYNPDDLTVGWDALFSNGKFAGIRVKYFDPTGNDKPTYTLRLLNITQTKQQPEPSSTLLYGTNKDAFLVKQATKLKIELENNPSGNIAFEISINKHNLANQYFCNLETVGLSRITTNSEYYGELVPGKGIKTTAGHGMIFYNYAQNPLDEGLGGTIQGDYSTPYFDMDAYDEASRTDTLEKAEYNGISVIDSGSEIECYSTSTSKGIINISTKCQTYSRAKKGIPQLSVIYDKRKNESALFYNDTDNMLNFKKISFDGSDNGNVITALGIMEASNQDYTYTNENIQKQIFLGMEHGLTDINMTTITKLGEDGYIDGKYYYDYTVRDAIGQISNLAGKTLTAYKKGGNGQHSYSHPNPGKEFSINGSSFKVVGLQITLSPMSISGMGTWAGTLCCKVSYMNSKTTEYVDFGLKTAYRGVVPTINYMFVGKNLPHTLRCPIIDSPTKMKIEYMIPDGLTDSEFDLYKNTLSANILTIKLLVVKDEQIAYAKNCSSYKNKNGEIFLTFQGAKLFDSNGNLINMDSVGDLKFSQMIETNENTAMWRGMRMSNFEYVVPAATDLQNERLGLANSKFSQAEINALVPNKRFWDRPSLLSTLGDSITNYSKKDHVLHHFGFTDSADDPSKGNLVMWPIHESLLQPIFTTESQNKTSIIDGNIIKTSSDISTTAENQKRILAKSIGKQSITASFSTNDFLLVFYQNNDTSLRAKVSDNRGTNWQDCKLQLFSQSSYFNSPICLFVMEEPFNKTFHFFALNSVPDSDGEYHLFTCSFPQFIFYNGLSDNEVVEWQNKINTTPKILVVGDSTTVSASDISSKKTIIGNAYKKQNGNYNNLPPFIRFGAPNWDYENFTDFIDKNINTQHSITGYIDAYKRIRVFYMDSNGNIASKVSDNYGDTWRADLAI